MRRGSLRGGPVRRKRQDRFAIKNWVNRLSDVPAFIVGNGPSLLDVDLDMLKPYMSLGINRAFYKIDPTILLWQDVSLWNTEFNTIHNLSAIKLCRDIADPRRVYYNFYLKGSEYIFKKCTHILYGRGSSGPLAVEFAYALGCNPIVCIGMDCKVCKEDGRTDFYGDNPFHSVATISNCNLGLTAIKELCPTKIINCSDNNILGPRVDIENAIKKADPKSEFAWGRQKYVRKLTKGA